MMASLVDIVVQGLLVQNPISTNPGLAFDKTCGTDPGFVLIGL